MYIIPDFFLFICILFSYVHLSTILIASFSRTSYFPIMAKSSAYANTCIPLSSSCWSRSLNMIRNSVGDSTPPCITPYPILISSILVLILVCLYSHFIVLVTYSRMPNLSIFSNRIWWLTVSKADFKSINKIHIPSCWLLLIWFLMYSVILRILISHPIPLLNPVCPLFNIHSCPTYRFFCRWLFSIVSSSL